MCASSTSATWATGTCTTTCCCRPTPSAARDARLGEFNRVVHDLVDQYEGSISAEHGVGQLRRDELRRYKPAVEYELMMRIKQALDPNHLMNPGKIF